MASHRTPELIAFGKKRIFEFRHATL
ncbi:unnamed protein product, partial [Rotaria sp. Silwood2]